MYASAPANDLELLKSLQQYYSINAVVAKATSQKMSNHLWYLAPEIVRLALFDSEVSINKGTDGKINDGLR